ncbi:MAG: hypothetical protein ABI868_03215 [Acidobacteriota bacterium]
MTTSNTVRRVEVRPPSARAELSTVVRFSMVIVIGAWMYLATDSATFRDAANITTHLLPFQAMMRDRPPTEQRMFRELQEGLLEAEMRRVDRGAWPEAPSLAADGIPPFALDPTAQGGRYDWRLTTSGALVNYLGLPQRADSPAWLILVQEPEPGAPPDPAREDEEHHLLSTGVKLHVSIWVRADGRVAGRIIRTPQAEGWTQLYAVGPALAPQPAVTVR